MQDKECSVCEAGVYRSVFCSEFNLSFHQPKKDQCTKCEQYENANEEEKIKLCNEYNEHIERKNRACSEKMADKEKATADNSVTALTVDSQSVLSTPCGNVSSLYYTRKLSVYNFTVYDQVSGDEFCYVWNETLGEWGANEIGSMLCMYINQHIPKETKHLVITSDSTVSQNRNQYVTAMLLYAVQTTSLESIEQEFLEPGHTEMEVDSMHAAIDSVRKNIKVNIPSEWLYNRATNRHCGSP